MRIPATLLAGTLVVLTGCATVPAAAPVVAIPSAAASLTTATKAPFGAYLVDSSGRSVYVLEGTRGTTGMSRCSGPCLGVWPPVMTAGPTTTAAGLNAAMAASVPAYGGTQATYGGWPLYYYSHDRAAGETTGQNVHDAWGHWYLLSPAGTPILSAGEGY
jgi:predicted lipoprotein with Yx(FWY)xxD motif